MENISASNLKSLLDFSNKNKQINILDVIDYYKPVAGYIYCMHNEMFKFYGENVHKCGNSCDVEKRLNQYTTSYPKPSKILILSETFVDKNFAESLLFFYLKDYKMEVDREFFNCDINIIQSAFNKVKEFFDKYKTKDKLFKYLNKNNYTEFYSFNDTEKIKLLQSIKKNNLCDKIKNDLHLKNDITEENFVNELNKKLSELSYEEFNNYYNKNYQDYIIYSDSLDKIKILFWLEKELNINRFDINSININEIDNIKNKLLDNCDNLYIIFKNNESKSKTIKSINYKINSIINNNYLQKFIAECYNNVINNSFDIQKKRIYLTRYKTTNQYLILKIW